MVNTNKLRGRIVEKGMNNIIVAEMMCLSKSTLGKKIRNQADFTLNEAVFLMKLLNIPKSEFFDYFIYE